MKHMAPCTIRHLQLEKDAEDLFLPLQRPQYCLFWWKQIPLGQLFVPPEKYAGEAEMREAALKAVSPAIEFYSAKHGVGAGNYREAFLAGHHRCFAAAMEKVLGEALRTGEPGPLAISVVICTRNRAEQLRRCLEQLLSQQWPPAEIIVVDNAPRDRSTAQVVSLYSAVKYHLEPRPGLDIARNTGARLATQPVVAYVDDDVLVHPQWAYRVWEAFGDPAISAMTGLVVASSLDTESQLIFEKYWSFNRGYRDKLFDSSFIRKARRGAAPVWDIGAGANMAFRKTVFQEVGYFDERLDVGAAGCSGDSEMWFRIISAGMRILYTPRAVVYHEHRAELRALRKQLFYYMRGFTAAALIQHTQDRSAGYRRHFYSVLVPYYWKLLKEGLPRYRGRHRTVVNEISGILSGALFFLKNRNKPAQTTLDQP